MSLAERALSDLATLAGRSGWDDLRIESGAPALASRFAADEAGAVALAAGAGEASDLWTLRTGDRQTATVATRHAAASLISFLYQRFEDENRAPRRIGPDTAANGFFQTRDGRFIYLHPSLDEAAGIRALLGCADEREAVAKALSDWDALPLEAAIAEAGHCAAMARTAAEWDDSDQGRLMAALPLVEVTRIGDGPAMPFTEAPTAPLSGVRVLDLTRILAGPTCARTLASYGADVLHIAGPDLPSVPPFVSDTGHGKRSAFLDLKDPAQRRQLLALVGEADIFSQGYRTGALERLGLSAETLAALRPGLIHVSINCYGHEGAWATRPGWEQLAQTVTGMAVIHGGEESPAIQPAAVNDYTTGYLAAFGAMVALRRRATEGGSWRVRVSLVQTATWVRGLGIAGQERLDAVAPMTGEELAGYSIRSESGFGPVTHLRPAVTLSKTPAAWTRPTVPLGVHPPVWS